MNQSFASNDLAAVLSECLRTRGQGLLGERRKLFGLLRDRVPGELRAVRLLMLAFDDGLPGRLQGRSVTESDVQRETSQFIANAGVTPELAREAVTTWARALTNFVPSAPPAGVQPVASPMPPAAVRPIPVQPIPVQPVPVQPVPVQPIATQPPAFPPAAPQLAPGAPAADQAAGAGQTDIKKWISILVAVVLALVAGSKALSLLQGGDSGSGSGSGPQTAGPPKTTPEGIPVMAASDPMPTFTTSRLGNDPMTLQFKFGVPVGNEAITYNVGFAFTRGRTQGVSRLIATKGGSEATGDNDAKRVNDSDNAKEELIIGGGGFKTNPIGAPGLCVVLMHIARRSDRLDLTPQSSACIMPSPGKDGKACGDVFACGNLN